jgi:hypothetical protein
MVTNQEWWYMPVILALGRWRQENCEFEASLDYIGNQLMSTSALKCVNF